MPIRNPEIQCGIPYHVFNRGVEKRDIFLIEEDKARFIQLLKKYLNNAINLVNYTLMPNHFHMTLVQKNKGVISKLLNQVCLSYVRYFNTRTGRCGPLFQGRFHAETVESNEQLIYLSLYIHTNPIKDLNISRTQKIAQLQNYRWSSYREYIGLDTKTGLIKNSLIKHVLLRSVPWIRRNFSQEYKKYIEQNLK